MWDTTNPLTIFLGISLIGAMLVIVFLYGREDNVTIARLQTDIEQQTGLTPLDRLTLRLEAARLQATNIVWIEKAVSAMGVIAFVGALGALVAQTIQNAALEQKSELEMSQLELFQKQADRAQALLQPVVGSVIQNFEQSGSRPTHDERELLSFAIDQWLAAPETNDNSYREDLKRAFRASLIVADYSAALDAANKLGRDFPQTNPAEQVSLFEYAYITGHGFAERERIRALLDAPSGTIAHNAELRLIAIARATRLLDERDAVIRASKASGLPLVKAASRLQKLGMRLRQSRDAVLAEGRTPAPGR